MKRQVETIIRSTYLEDIYHVNSFTDLIKQATNALREFRKQNYFDSIAFSGYSGAAFAYPISYKLKIPLICVRKENESSHYARYKTSNKVEGFYSAKKYLILDDFMATGLTIRRILKNIDAKIPEAKCIAIALWRLNKKYNKQYIIHSSRESIPVVGLLETEH